MTVYTQVGALKAQLTTGQRLMGLDVGTKTVGLALTDVMGIIATPMETMFRTKFMKDAEILRAMVIEHDVGGLIVGLPISMDGTEGPRCQGVRQFVENLLGVFDIPVAFWDERLSTSAVERILIGQADMSRKKRKAVVDKAAAAYILQGAMDAAG